MSKSVAISLAFWAALAGATRSACAADAVDYLRDVKTTLKSRCYACHGALKQEARLRLDSAAGMLRGGDSGPAIVPGKPAASLLVKRIASHEDAERMPAEGRPLSADEIAKISQWIATGAVVPSDDRPEADPREHWAFRPPVRPAVPAVAETAWVRNPIDAFVAAEHERHNVAPNPEADRSTLLRRAYLDLIGLPPTREQLHRFLADDSRDAYEQEVD
ncbi:MAG TPA: c-type cytochrome domain-containing protein, partial [Pirellulales bacterium]|nr:c-type cytochrome domain-containing protein [Pirellulales bacterium]